MRARIISTVAAILVLAIVLGWRFAGRPAAHSSAESVPLTDQTTPVASGATPPHLSETQNPSLPPTDTVDPAVAASGPPPIEVTFGAPSWDAEIQAIFAREKGAAARSRALLAMLPRAPEEALADITERAIDDLPDRDYAATALPIVTNPKTAGQVMAVLFADLMERPDAITLPALVAIARNAQHPFAPSAVDNLRLLLRADRGSDWAAWEKDVREQLAAGR